MILNWILSLAKPFDIFFLRFKIKASLSFFLVGILKKEVEFVSHVSWKQAFCLQEWLQILQKLVQLQ